MIRRVDWPVRRPACTVLVCLLLVLPCTDAGRAAAEVLILGFPVLEGQQPRETPIVRRGLVASAELPWDGKLMSLLDLTGVPGFSGAPVAPRDSAEVCALVFGPGRTERHDDLEWAMPLSQQDLRRHELR